MSVSIEDLAREIADKTGDTLDEARDGVRVLAGQIVEIDGDSAMDGDDLTEATADAVREAYQPESQREDRQS